MTDLTFKISPHIAVGSFLAARIGALAMQWAARFIVIIDPVFRRTGRGEAIFASLVDRKIPYFVFEKISNAEDTRTIRQALMLARRGRVQGVIAAGGTKTLNVGRAVAALFHETHDVYDFADGAVPAAAPLPLLCVPTTMRAEFLFHDCVPIVDARSRRIRVIKTREASPRLALFDPNLTQSLSERQTAAMSLETLCIACEAYLSQKASFFSDMLIEKSLEMFRDALDGPEPRSAELLTQGGCLASLGVASSAPGAASLISLCVNARYKTPRALTTAALFPYMLEDAMGYKQARLEKIARILGASDGAQSAEDAARRLVDYAARRVESAGVPARLRESGLTLEQFALAAEDIGQLDFMNTLPRSMTVDDLFAIVKRAF